MRDYIEVKLTCVAGGAASTSTRVPAKSSASLTRQRARDSISWKTAWHKALTTAKVEARWHDLRHTLISRLAENPNVSEETILALAGHVSRAMLARYSHIRADAKRAAISTLEQQENAVGSPDPD